MRDFGAAAAALVRSAWVPARRGPSHRAEMVTQWLCGEAVELLEEREGWLRARGGDGYEAWTPAGGLVPAPEGERARWTPERTLVSIGTDLQAVPGARGARFLPWGARALPAGEGQLELPGGARALAGDREALLDEAQRSRRYPRDAGAVVRTAADWIGTPYLWGGRTREGADCSGLVQAVFGLHGLPLPRDSGPQSRVGRLLAGTVGGRGEAVDFGDLPPLRPGDLLFFGETGGPISHVALSLGGARILHGSETRGGVFEDDLGGTSPPVPWLRSRLRAATRPLERASGA